MHCDLSCKCSPVHAQTAYPSKLVFLTNTYFFSRIDSN